MAGVDVPVDPYRRHIFITQPPPGGAWDVPATRVMVIDFDSTFYFHREGAGVLFGMGDPARGADVRPDGAVGSARAHHARGGAPAAGAGRRADRARLGRVVRDDTGREPHHRRSPRASRGFYVIAGFSGHGFQHSPAAGRILADVIAGQDPKFDLSPFAARRASTGAVVPLQAERRGAQL